ncbi:MAG: sensor histidine kinase [Christensenellaceae bacterium]|jgi:signal transduction histidine kinase
MSEAFVPIVCACAAAAVVLVAVWLRRKTVRAFRSVEDTLEQMVSGSFTDSASLYEDTFSAKINTRLKRLYAIMEEREMRNRKEHGHIQEMVSDISHQVKTPIANIKMLSETLRDAKLPPDKRNELHAQLGAQIDKLDFLMQALVKSSRLETGVIMPAKETLPVMETLAQAVGSVAALADSKDIEITVNCDEKTCAMHDKKWTAEAFFNILDNAVKYTPPGGSVAITCEQWEFYTKIEIGDTGTGIAEEEQAQVFKRFYRSPSVRQQDGIGIGLYLAREIVEKQGGYIKVASVPGEGSVFSIFLPNS